MSSAQDPFFRFINVAAEKQTYLNLLYLLLMFPLGVIYFIVVVIGFSLSVSLLLIVIGIFISFGFLVLVRGIATLHLSFASRLLDFELPPGEMTSTISKGIFDRLKKIATNLKTYTSMFYMFIELPLGVLYFSMIITLISISISFIVTPIAWSFFKYKDIIIPFSFIKGENIYILGDRQFTDLTLDETLFLMIGGFFLFFMTLHLGNLFAKIEKILSKNLLLGL